MQRLQRGAAITESVFDRLDRPETWIALHGFFAAFAWEMFQMPFFAMDHLSAWEVTKNCGIASVGDGGIMVFAYWTASRTAGNRLWLQTSTVAPIAVYLTTGLAITVAVESLALRSDWGWQYSELMPRVAGVGLVPLAMWIVVPWVALRLAKRSVSGGRPAC